MLDRPAVAARLIRPLRRVVGCAALLVLALLAIASTAGAATPMVDLGAASSYGVLSGASVDNTVSAVGAPHTTIRGDLGVKAAATPTGFPPGIVTGSIEVGTPAAAQAHAAAVSAYEEIVLRPGGTPLAGVLTGITVGPGLYFIGGAASNTGTFTLDAGGDPDAVFVLQVNGALALAAASHVRLAGGARADHVFWQVNGAGSVGAGSTFVGTMIAMDAIGIGAGTLVNGRLLARNGALTLDANEVYATAPAVTIDGGASASTTSSTPTITGTTSVEAPADVSVTIGGQTLSAVPADGAFSVQASRVPNGTYAVVATVVDGAGNVSSVSQQLTVDTVPPLVTLDGGAARSTQDTTVLVSGTNDAASGAIVFVEVGGQSLRAVTNAGGSWNVTTATLALGEYEVRATVYDAAGNAGVATQQLTVTAVVVLEPAPPVVSDPPPTAAPPLAPSVATGPIHGVGSRSAVLTGAVATNGSVTRVVFEYGATSLYGRRVAASHAEAGGIILAAATLGGLAPGATYHYRLVGSNSAGSVHGLDMTFRTRRAFPRSVTLATSLRRDARGRTQRLVEGVVLRPAGVSATRGCRGTILVAVRRAGRLVAGRRVPVRIDCRYRAILPVVRRATITASFSGNVAMFPRRSRMVGT